MYSKLGNAYLCIYFKPGMSYKAISMSASGLIGRELLNLYSPKGELDEIVWLNSRPLKVYVIKTTH